MKTLKLMALLAHPDDEFLGFSGTLGKSSAKGVETHVVIATRRQAGRHGGEDSHAGPEALGRIPEVGLQAAARELVIHSLFVLDGGNCRHRQVISRGHEPHAHRGRRGPRSASVAGMVDHDPNRCT